MQKIIIANWKMHKTIMESVQFVEELLPFLDKTELAVGLAPPFTSLSTVAEKARNSNLLIGAQNISAYAEGAYTGDVSALMIKEAGATFVILGHSERRRLHHETSQDVNSKVKEALAQDLFPLVCIGETWEERNTGNTEAVLKNQLLNALEGVSNAISHIMIAYEPIWAIGTNQAANTENIAQVHSYCRSLVKEHWGEKCAIKLPILYGGSVKSDNALELLECEEINGLLVGGASLTIDSFCKILTPGVTLL